MTAARSKDGIPLPDEFIRAPLLRKKLYAFTPRALSAREYAVGQRPAGTAYGYHIVGKFSDKEGTGKRVEGRPCDVTFVKKE